MSNTCGRNRATAGSPLGVAGKAYASGSIPLAAVLVAAVMLPHSWTLLLEGEGYVLAAFFGLLIPIHLCQPSLGGTAWGRFGRVLLLNLKANVLVALVLAVAACYEAIEVITMAR